MFRSSYRHRFQLEALEPRVLLSADGLAGAALAGNKLAGGIEVVQTVPVAPAATDAGFNQLLIADVAQNPRSAAAQIESIFGPASTAKSAAAPADARAAASSLTAAPPSEAQAAESAAVMAPATTLPAQSPAESAVASPNAPVAADSIPSQLVETLHASQGPPASGNTNLLNVATSLESGRNGTLFAADAAAATVTWASNGDGFWDVASNWSTGLTPTSTDSVLIDKPGVTVTIRTGTVQVSDLVNNDTLAVTGGSLEVTHEADINGAFNFSGGTVTATGVFNLKGSGTWTGGTLAGPGGFYNTGAWHWTGGTKFLTSVVVNNSGTITHDSGQVQFRTAVFNNLLTGVYDVATDGDFLLNAANPSAFNNAGILDKTAGTGSSNMPGLPFNNVPSGIVKSDSGTLNLSGGGTSTGGTYIAALNAAINVAGGSTTTWNGTFTGSGSGAVVLNGGVLVGGTDGAILSFSAGLFHWQGGTFTGNITNTGDMVIDGGTKFLTDGTLTNSGTIEHLSGQTQFRRGVINNAGTGVYSVQTDGDIFWNGADPSGFNNAGTIDKAAGTGSSNMPGLPFNNVPGGIVESETGTLNLSGGGTSTGGIYIAALNAAINVAGGSTVTWNGTFTGSGSGAVVLNGGALVGGADGAIFNFATGLFHWQGGTLSGSITNAGDLVIDGGTKFLTDGTLTNSGTVEHTSGLTQFRHGIINNASSGVYYVQTDGDIFWDGADPSGFNNAGTIDKTAGTGSSNMPGLPFNNVPGGVVRSDTGTLNLSGGGTSTGGTYIAALNAAINVAGGSTATWDGTFTGSGAGAVVLNGGVLQAGTDGAVLNFSAGLFHWQGGTLSGSFTNTGAMVIDGGTKFLTDGTLTNKATIEHTSGQLQFRRAVINNASTASILCGRTATFSGTAPIRVASTMRARSTRRRARVRRTCRGCRSTMLRVESSSLRPARSTWVAAGRARAEPTSRHRARRLISPADRRPPGTEPSPDPGPARSC